MSAMVNMPTRLVFGVDAIDELGDLARELGGQRVLVVTDAGVAAAGHLARATAALTRAGLVAEVFDAVRPNPTTADVEACRAAARAAGADLLVGLGGGSSIDTARGCNFLLTNGGRMEDYRGRNTASQPMLPLIAVPTTTGTGSEMQSFAIIADERTHEKMACGDPKAAAAVAVLDPTLATTQPRFVLACTGMDCVAHAVESAVTRARTPESVTFAQQAWTTASASFPRVLADPTDLEALGAMLRASAFAGIAIERSMLGAAHALANPLTAVYDVVHGHAVGMMLAHVVRFNAEDEETRHEYADLGRLADPDLDDASDETAVEAFVDRIVGLLDRAELPSTLAACGVPGAAVDTLAEAASRQWTAQFNPRSVSVEDLAALYRAACPS